MKGVWIRIGEDDISSLRAGTEVFLSGRIFTMRDKAHARILKERPPFDLAGGVIYHCGPIVRKNKHFKVISAGPTTSSRMCGYLPRIIAKYGISGIIGKGGVNKEVIDIMKKKKCVYFAFTGGCGALAARCMKITNVYWEDLGMVESVWEMNINDLPVIVAIDTEGNSLYNSNRIKNEHD